MVTQSQIDSAESLKDAGNDAVKRGEWAEANDYYTEALQLTSESDKALRAALYRNRALTRLKRDDFEGTESDATKALEYDGADVKALYRRALAREQLDNVAAAFKDAKEALRLSPKDKSISDLLQRLVVANNEKVKKATSMDNKVKDMSSLAFEGNAKDKEQKVQAYNNLLVLARETEAGAARIWNLGKGVPILLSVAENNNEPLEISVAAVRILDEIIKNHGRALYFLSMHDTDGLRSARRVCRLMCARDAKEYVDASGLIVQRIFNALVKMDRTKDIKPDPEVAEANKLWIIRVILELQSMLTDKTVTAIVREMVIDILLKNLMHMDGGIPRGWSWKFTEESGLLALLDVSSQIPEQCDYPVSHETRQHVAICLQRLDEDMVSPSRFACEGLSYLSLDADVKEWIVADSLLLRALFCLAQSAGALCVFTLATIYVNLANAYEKPNVDEEMVKLAQFAKHHVPEIHHKDTDDYVEKRIRCLVEEGAVAACVAVSKTESHKALELLARYFSPFIHSPWFQKGTDKLKLWVLYAAEEGERLARAASAAFAILTEDVDANRRILDEVKTWPDVFKEIAMHEDPEAQRRGLMGIANIMESDEKLCAEIVASEVFRVLVAITKLGPKNEARKGATEQAKRGLAAAEKFGIIRPTDREMYERTNQVSTIREE
ncbi:tetratricopeptide repeat protein [Ancylostoma caninum]|uniref:Tetratricopeptide repeat protein n=1 Tax=Ancylostoma caninum TaxID=29170 RepID=A0A368FGF5_ANCCA|nr:tetratricopeptide repeat protein [Ancylostoma caninum]